MKTHSIASLVLALSFFFAGCRTSSGDVHGQGPFLSHDVFFVLTDDSPETRKDFEAALLALAAIPEVLDITVGSRAADLEFAVNDVEFQVVLHTLLANKFDLERYRTSSIHRDFLVTWKDRIATAVVRDAWVRRP